MKLSYWIALAVVLSLVLIIKDMPASWAGRYVNNNFDSVEVNGTSGSLWRGRATQVLLKGDGEAFALGELQWVLKPWSLLWLNPCIDFKTEYHSQSLEGEACAHGDGSWSLHQGEFYGPAALIGLWFPVQVDGELSVLVTEARVKGERIEALKVDSSWRDARFYNSHQWLSLGSFATQLQSDNKGGVTGKLFDIDGPVAMDLEARVPMGNGVTLEGSVELRQGAPEEIAQLLTVMGYRNVNGRFDILWRQPQ